jgi:hypothetical protein
VLFGATVSSLAAAWQFATLERSSATQNRARHLLQCMRPLVADIVAKVF